MKPLPTKSIVFLGATGAVGTEALKTLLTMPQVDQISLLGRRSVSWVTAEHVSQHTIDIFQPAEYANLLAGHEVAICTLGVGQPSTMSKAAFLRIDFQAVLDFATACKAAGVQHFELLSSVGIDPEARSFYLSAKGELVEKLKALAFTRLSIFQPSMIITPTNRYGLLQAIALRFFPLLDPLLVGRLRKFRSVKVETLGAAMAHNVGLSGKGYEAISWSGFQQLVTPVP